MRAQGLAIADSPEGPFVKHEMNPIINSGHETCVFPWGEGLVALAAETWRTGGAGERSAQELDEELEEAQAASIVVFLGSLTDKERAGE